MSYPDFTAGYISVVKIDDSAGVLQTWTNYGGGGDASYDADVHDVSTMGNEAKAKIVGQDDASMSLNGPWHAQIEAWVAWPAGRKVKRTVELYPEGEGSGKRKQTFEAFIQSYKVSSGVGDAAKYDVALTKTGDATFSVVP